MGVQRVPQERARSRMDLELFQRVFEAVFKTKPPMNEDALTWVRYAQPVDLARIVRLEREQGNAYALLRHRVEDRLQRLTPTHGPALKDLCGLGEAKVRADMLIADIRAALAGKIPWAAVDRGMLLIGPPGCGKTSLARAIAKDCGVHFLECSAAS
ncbi:hypothetical protein DQK91_21425 [Oceanidesulfovibrio marinus]|uniref:ATPase AAA-type core domain-containing protein n=1 Tax=Oceanidesulfovibrio marinus TaxID=370038 RepID=A0A6P1ZBR4_9BACT|nr:hypothetical protein DQK91_21425 [Oceanidesulfovibrio marinus]